MLPGDADRDLERERVEASGRRASGAAAVLVGFHEQFFRVPASYTIAPSGIHAQNDRIAPLLRIVARADPALG